MLSDEILKTLQSLDHADKLKVMQFLLAEFAKEEGTPLLQDAEYPVWTPYDSYEAEQTLREYMQARKARNNASFLPLGNGF